MKENNEVLRELFAKVVHDSWSDWMKYLFSKCDTIYKHPEDMNDFTEYTIIPTWVYKRWKRQMETSYEELPDNEKESDRKEADRYLDALNSFYEKMLENSKSLSADICKAISEHFWELFDEKDRRL